MRKKRVLVTGASGFIGRNIFEALLGRKDLEVFGTYFTRKFSTNPHLWLADLTKADAVSLVTKKMDVLIHTAAVTAGSKYIVEQPSMYIPDNEIMNTLLLKAAYENCIQQAILLSCTVIYPMNLGYPLKETDLDLRQGLHPKYKVGWIKIALENFSQIYAGLGRTRFTLLSHSNIYGPYDKFDLDRSHVLGATITKVMNARKGDNIVVWGDGKETRDLLHASDLVNFVEKVIDGQDYDYDVFNVGLGRSVTIRELVEKVIHVSGKKLTVEYDTKKPTIPTSLMLDISKSYRKFGWAPQVSLDQGIQRTVAWYLKNVQRGGL